MSRSRWPGNPGTGFPSKKTSPCRSPRGSPCRSPRGSPERSLRGSPERSPRGSSERSSWRRPERSSWRSTERRSWRSSQRSPMRSPKRSSWRNTQKNLCRSPEKSPRECPESSARGRPEISSWRSPQRSSHHAGLRVHPRGNRGQPQTSWREGAAGPTTSHFGRVSRLNTIKGRGLKDIYSNRGDRSGEFDEKVAAELPESENTKQCPKYEQRRKVILDTFKDIRKTVMKQGPSRLTFKQWFAKHADNQFPHMDKIAYSCPAYFTGNSKTKVYAPERVPESLKCDFLRSEVQESDVRGDRAQCAVESVFLIYSQRRASMKEHPLFIRGQAHFDNLLAWLRRPCREVKKKFSEIFDQVQCEILKKIGRGETDLMVIHPNKGVLFAQIKSTEKSERVASDIDTVITAAKEQLKKDVEVFEIIMRQDIFDRETTKATVVCKATKVIALPNLLREDIAKHIDANKDIVFLCKDDLPEDFYDVSVPDSEMTLDCFQRWLDQIPDQPIEADVLKEIVGKYAGLLSTAVKCKGGNKRDRLRCYADSIRDTACLFRRSMIIDKQIEISQELLQNPSINHRAYISGPPGSGKTQLLILHAISFLSASPSRLVIVLDMNRGSKGRAIGQYVFSKVRQSFEDRVHHLPVDVMSGGTFNRGEFVKDIFSLTRNSEEAFELEDLLFVVDEIYTECFCLEILESFQKEFAKCKVVCAAGLFSRKPEKFTEYNLTLVHRYPPCLQRLMYSVDWDDSRKDHYKGVSVDPAVATLGPTPLCVSHESHVPRVSVTECRQCAMNVCTLLRDVKFRCMRVGNAADAQTETQGACGEEELPTCPDDLKLAIIVNFPRRLYTKCGKYITTTLSRYKAYMKYIAKCPFIQTLKDQGISVVVEEELECKDIADENSRPLHIATWIYNFEGLEADLVIFLPGDSPWTDGQNDDTEQDQATTKGSEEHRKNPKLPCGHSSESQCLQDAVKTEREIPAPGLSLDSDYGCEPDIKPLIVQEADLPKATSKKETSAIPDSRYYDSGVRLHWGNRDIERLSLWDRTNILVAGPMCRTLFILIVP